MVTINPIIYEEFFSIYDKYVLISISVLLLIFSVGLFVILEDLNKIEKLQLKRKSVGIYVFSLLIFIFFSIFITVPYIEHKTIISEKVLAEALFDDKNQILLQRIENTFFPQYNGSYLLWYTRNFEDKRFLESEKVIKMYYFQQSTLYEINNSRIFSIKEADRPLKYRGIETQSFYYSYFLIIYNILIAIFAFPLFTIYKTKIKILWKAQSIISSILIAITISNILMF